MSRPRFALAVLAGLVLTVPLGGCPLDAASLGGPPTLAGGTITNVRTNLDPAKSSVTSGEVITLWVETNLPASGLGYQWSATGGSLSSFGGQQVQWTAGGAGRVRVSCVITSGSDTKVAEYLFTVR